MLITMRERPKDSSKLNRRDAMIGLGQLTLGTVALPGLLRAERAVAAVSNSRSSILNPRCRSCILIFLWGGPRTWTCGT